MSDHMNISGQPSRRRIVQLGAAAFAGLIGGSMSEQGNAAGQTHRGVADNPNVTLIKQYYQAYGSGDLDAVRSIFAPDIVWRIPGHHPLAGVKRGAEEVFAFFQQLFQVAAALMEKKEQ
jgi:nitrous oxide reductase